MFPKIDPTSTSSWEKLSALATADAQDIRKLFDDKDRVSKYSFTLGQDFHLDLSKCSVSDSILEQLIHLGKECRVEEGIEAMFSGEIINETEGRAVLHVALRSQSRPEVEGELEKIKNFSDKLLGKTWKGFSEKTITDVVNIGIGGSDLGPKMISNALRPYWRHITPHYISNVDAAQMDETLESLDPETTLFIIASKTFTTQETITNATTARSWFLKSGGSESDISRHFVAVSTNAPAANEFGIPTENMFEFWDWVGGRFSLWSAIGLSIACCVGFAKFRELLDGAKAMDEHFSTAPLKKNLPFLSAMIGIWHNNFLGYDSLAMLPYDHRLRYLPSFLQQVDMESNGKGVDRSGNKISYESGPIVWGEPGTNGQHAFYQLIHQGTKTIPCEFLAVANPHHNHLDHHEKLLANFFAQAEALLAGKSKEKVLEELGSDADELLVASKVFEGNRPSTSILLKELTPYALGELIAFYEHRVFTQGFIWNIFSFDQWGVELGKQLSKPILHEIKTGQSGAHDPSTISLMNRYRDMLK